MSDIHVHVHMRKCCRQTLKKLDEIRAAAKRAAGPSQPARASAGGASTLLSVLGSSPIPKATLTVSQLHAARSDLLQVDAGGKSAWDKAILGHSKFHEDARETAEAAFWRALAVPLEVIDLTVSPEAYKQMVDMFDGKNKISVGGEGDKAGLGLMKKFGDLTGHNISFKKAQVFFKVHSSSDGSSLHIGVGPMKGPDGSYGGGVSIQKSDGDR